MLHTLMRIPTFRIMVSNEYKVRGVMMMMQKINPKKVKKKNNDF